jgi:hypothetical protein
MSMKDLLLERKVEGEQTKAPGQHDLDLLVYATVLRCPDETLQEGSQANPSPALEKALTFFFFQ